MKEDFTVSDIKNIFGLSNQRVHYFMLLNIIRPSIEKVGPGRSNRYSFQDIYELAIALRMLQLGIKLKTLQEFMGDFRMFTYEGLLEEEDRVDDSDNTPWRDCTHLYMYLYKNKQAMTYMAIKNFQDEKEIEKLKEFENSVAQSFHLNLSKIREDLILKIDTGKTPEEAKYIEGMTGSTTMIIKQIISPKKNA